MTTEHRTLQNRSGLFTYLQPIQSAISKKLSRRSSRESSGTSQAIIEASWVFNEVSEGFLFHFLGQSRVFNGDFRRDM